MAGPWVLSTDGSVPGASNGYCPGNCHALQLVGRRDLTLLIEPGAELQAKRGDWHAPVGSHVPMLGLDTCHNVTILAYGAKISMWKADYANKSAYNFSEFRFGLEVFNSSDLRVLGLNVSSTGGDGIYLQAVTNVYIKDCQLVDNLRQGISVIDAVNLTVEDTLLAGTSGAWPMSGLDLEPDGPNQRLQNLTFRRVESRGNAGCGFQIEPGPLDHPISVVFEDCITRGNGQIGYNFAGMQSSTATGSVKIIRGSVQDEVVGLAFTDKNAASVLVTVSQLAITGTTPSGPGEGKDPLDGMYLRAPVVFSSYEPAVHPWKKFPFGGVVFDRLSVSYSRTNASSRAPVWPWLRIYHQDVHMPRKLPNPGEANITGTVDLYTETPATSCPGVSIGEPTGPRVNVSIRVECNPN